MNLLLLLDELIAAGLPAVGVSGDGRIDYARILTAAETLLAEQVVATHNPAGLSLRQQDEAAAEVAKSDFRNLPNYSTWTPNEAQDNITAMILAGKTLAQINTDIDNLPNTIAGMKTGLKSVAQGIVNLRTVLAIIGKLVILLRNVAIRHL